MPKADSTAPINTQCFGVAVDFNTPKPHGISDKIGLVQIKYDTGIIIYVPPMMFDRMVFEIGDGECAAGYFTNGKRS